MAFKSFGTFGGFGGSSKEDDLLAIAKQLGIEPPKPQANFLERILAPITGIGSIPDALLASMQGKNPLERYLSNVQRGFQEAFTGERVLDDVKTTSDIFKHLNILQSDDPLSKIANFGLGFAGDVVASPDTWLSFGLSGIGRKAAQEGVEALVKKAGRMAPELIDNLTETIATKGLKAGGTLLRKEGLETEAKFLTNILKEAPAKRTLEAFGQKVALPKGVDIALEAGLNPLGLAFKGAKAGAKKILPEFYDKLSGTANKLFRAGADEASKGYGDLFEQVRNFSKGAHGQDRKVMAEMGPIVAEIQKLEKTTPGITESIGQMIEGTMPTTPELQKVVTDLTDVFAKQGSELKSSGVLGNLVDNVNYAPRDVLGFKPKFIKTKFGQEAEAILTDPRAVKDITKNNFLSSETLNEILGESPVFKTGIAGLRSPERYLEGAQLQRTFDTLEKGIDAGVVYNKNAAEVMTKGIAKGQRAILAKDFAEGLKTQTDDFGNKILRSEKELEGNIPIGWEPLNLDQFGGEEKEIINTSAQALKDTKPVKDGLIRIEKSNKKELRSLNRELNRLNKEGLGLSLRKEATETPQVATYLRERAKKGQVTAIVPKTGEKFTVPVYKIDEITRDLFNKEPKIRDVVNSLFAEDPYRLRQIRDMIARRDEKAAGVIDEISGIRSQLDNINIERSTAFQQIRNTKLENTFYAPKEAVAVIKNYAEDFFGDDGMKKAMEWYDKGLQLWKASVTGYSPGFIGFQARNAIGDMTNMLIGGFRNRDGALGKGFKALEFEDVVSKEGREVAEQKFGKEAVELYDKSIQYGIVNSDTIDEYIGKGKGKLRKVVDTVTQTKRFRRREEGFRVANFYDAFKRSGNWDEAAKIARQSSLDYSAMTPFERNVMKRVVPFYGFMRQNLEHQLKTFVSNPRALNIKRKFFDNIRKSLGSELSDEEYDTLPDWMKEGMHIVMGRKDNTVDILTGLGDPSEAINDLVSLNPKRQVMNLLRSSSPMLKIPTELATGQDFFREAPISENKSGSRYSEYPEILKNVLGYKETEYTTKEGEKKLRKELDPIRAYLLENLPLIAPTNTMAKRVIESTKDPKYLINILSGGRIYEQDLDLAKYYKDKELQETIQDLLIQSGIGSQYEKFYIPEKVKREKGIK